MKMAHLIALGLFIAIPATAPAVAGPGHGDGHDGEHKTHANERKSVAELQISARSESYQLDGIVKDGVLTVRLKRVSDGLPVTGAKIELTIDGESSAAIAKKDGTYRYRLKDPSNKGKREVIAAINEGEKSDLLIGVLGNRRGKSRSAAQAGHADHSDHADHKGHGHEAHGAEGAVKLTPEVMREFGVTTEQAAPGTLADSITRPAEITFNMDRFTHVVPRVAGIAKSINASQGDRIKLGQVLAVLESRELAELKAAYLAAIERHGLAKDEYERSKELRKKKITSDKSYLTNRAAYAEARIALRSAKQKLNSIGIDDKVLAIIVKEPDSILTQYALRAPMGGMVIKRHLVQGESVPNDREAFVIADISAVWVNISIYAGDLPKVRAGQRVTLETETGQTAEGKISFVSPDVSEQTRTATARVVLKGPSRAFRPGMFIKADIDIAETEVAIRIPQSAIHTKDGQKVVFAREGEEFKPKPIKIGRRNGHYAEVLAGLKPGETYAAKGAFLIKSQLSKASFGDGHNH